MVLIAEPEESFLCEHKVFRVSTSSLTSMYCEVSFILFGDNVMAYGDNVMSNMVE